MRTRRAGQRRTPRWLPIAAADTGGNLGKQTKITWQAPVSTNGAAITSYEVYANQKKVGETTGDASSFTASVVNGTTYTFTVTASNKAGASVPSEPAPQLTPYGAPARPAAPALKATGAGPGNVTNTWSAAQANGHAVTSYQVGASGGPKPPFGQSPETVRAKGADKFRVKACSNDKCSTCSAWSNVVEPYGPPGRPSVSAKGNATTVKFTWSAGTTNGKKPLEYKFRTAVNGKWTQWKGGPPSPVTAGNDYGQTVSIQMVAINQAGQEPAKALAKGRTDKRPDPKPKVSKGGRHASCENVPYPNCAKVRIEIADYPHNSTVSCLLESDTDHPGWPAWKPKKLSTNGSGDGSDTSSFYGWTGERLRVTCDGKTFPVVPIVMDPCGTLFTDRRPIRRMPCP